MYNIDEEIIKINFLLLGNYHDNIMINEQIGILENEVNTKQEEWQQVIQLDTNITFDATYANKIKAIKNLQADNDKNLIERKLLDKVLAKLTKNNDKYNTDEKKYERIEAINQELKTLNNEKSNLAKQKLDEETLDKFNKVSLKCANLKEQKRLVSTKGGWVTLYWTLIT